jgi:hypothetical protein
VVGSKTKNNGDARNRTLQQTEAKATFPVSIGITQCRLGVLISAEMPCTVVMKEDAAPEIGLGIKRVMAVVLRISWTPRECGLTFCSGVNRSGR